MKVFIVYCHPSEDSFTRNVRDAFIKGIASLDRIIGTCLRQKYLFFYLELVLLGNLSTFD